MIKIPWNKGKKLSKQHKVNLRKNHKGTLGLKLLSVSKALKGKKRSEQICINISNGKIGKKLTEKHKRSIRLGAIRRIEKNHGQCIPNFNIKACKIFDKFDKQNNIKGQYATNGGEYRIKELERWPDYINFILKLIIEIDEKKHFDKSGNLKEKDIQRQKEIQELYPDFKFMRFKEEEMDKVLELKLENKKEGK